MYLLQANDNFHKPEFLESWDYEAGELNGFAYTSDITKAKTYPCLQLAWEDLMSKGFGMCFMIVHKDNIYKYFKEE